MIKIYDTPVDLGWVLFGECEDIQRDHFEKTMVKVEELGITVQRYNTQDNPQECIDKPLPYIVVGDNVFEGKYPSTEELANDLKVDATSIRIPNTLLKQASECRLGSCCGVGSDVYLDPNDK